MSDKLVTSVTEYIEWINEMYKAKNKHLFFRGHEKTCHKLIPSVLRRDGKGKWNEKEILLDFCNYANTLNISYNKVYEIDKLLFDMQHYGLPTRLLDWSVNPLVALYCACQNNGNECDGRVYMFDPWKYNKEFLKIDYNIPENHQIQILARALLAYNWKPNYIEEYLKKEYIRVEINSYYWQYPCATVSPFSNNRKLHQRGTFMIWGDSVCELDDTVFEDYGSRVQIPFRHKKVILDDLNKLYINEYTVYPDYEGMGKMIKSRGGLFNINRR